jgi:peptide/nickel transport system permease protein
MNAPTSTTDSASARATVDAFSEHGDAEVLTSVAAGFTFDEHRHRRFRVGVIVAAGWLILLVFASVFADLLPIDGPNDVPSGVDACYSCDPDLFSSQPLGTDQLGRSQLSRVIHGARISLLIGAIATTLALTLGTAFGMAAGFLKGPTDFVFDISTNVLLAFPPLILLIALASFVQPDVFTLALILGVLVLPVFARIARANTLALANREFVTASRALGTKNSRIMVREILPNVMIPVSAFALVICAVLIVAEGSLSFLGLGVRPPDPSWGGMISLGYANMADAPWLVFVPAIFLFLTVLSLNTVGEWVRGRLGQEAAL